MALTDEQREHWQEIVDHTKERTAHHGESKGWHSFPNSLVIAVADHLAEVEAALATSVGEALTDAETIASANESIRLIAKQCDEALAAMAAERAKVARLREGVAEVRRRMRDPSEADARSVEIIDSILDATGDPS